MSSRFHLIPERYGRTDGQTDGQTDRETDRFAISISGVSMLTRDKNGVEKAPTWAERSGAVSAVVPEFIGAWLLTMLSWPSIRTRDAEVRHRHRNLDSCGQKGQLGSLSSCRLNLYGATITAFSQHSSAVGCWTFMHRVDTLSTFDERLSTVQCPVSRPWAGDDLKFHHPNKLRQQFAVIRNRYGEIAHYHSAAVHFPPSIFTILRYVVFFSSSWLHTEISMAAFKKSCRLIRLIWSPLLPFVYSIVSIRSIWICVRLLHRDYSEHDLSHSLANMHCSSSTTVV